MSNGNYKNIKVNTTEKGFSVNKMKHLKLNTLLKEIGKTIKKILLIVTPDPSQRIVISIIHSNIKKIV